MNNRFRSLKHVVRRLPGDGVVLVLDTGSKIEAEANAMLQALHSRSLGGILEHLKVLIEKGPEKFMETFYVGYNHKSIGDCGTGTIFIEGVSMLVAKAIQDWMLYSGQEASTRYIDFASQPFIDPIGNRESYGILENWRSFYVENLDTVRAHLKRQFPKEDGESDDRYEKAINARAFDVIRGFLPAGAATKLAWHTNLRQCADKLALLRHHPLDEVRTVADAIESAVREAYSSSFGHKRYPATEGYNSIWMKGAYLYEGDACDGVILHRDDIDRLQLLENRELLEMRPAKTELPKFLAECGTMQFQYMLDFASFRDIQRHRAVTQRMPLVTTRYGFNQWYLDELPAVIRKKGASLLRDGARRIDKVAGDNKWIAQYYVPMGYNLPQRLTGDLPALVYLVELRASSVVHPTLAHVAGDMASILGDCLNKWGLVLHLDPDPGRFNVKRGDHDIVRVS